MLRPERVALELFEYKIADLQADRQVLGGVSSIWELYHHLSKLAMQLTDAERQRFHDLSRALRKLDELPTTAQAPRLDLETLVIDDLKLTPGPSVKRGVSFFETREPVVERDPVLREEQLVLQRLARAVWWSELEDVLQELAARCRAEKDRATARLLYALSRNLDHLVRISATGHEVSLAHYQTPEAIPERLDPLVSLNNLENLSDLLREITQAVMSIADGQGLYSRLNVPKGHALGFVRKVALAIARDPYAGRLSQAAPRGPSSAQLRLAMQELAKERLPEEEKRAQINALELRLRQTLLVERQQREAFQQDVQHFVQTSEAFFDRLERYLPVKAGGEAGEPQLKGGVLFAENPALRLNKVSSDARNVTVRLKGPTRFMLGGLEMAVTGSARAQALSIGEHSYPLQPRLKIDLERHAVVAILEGVYLHLQVANTGRPLASLLAEALAVFTVLASQHTAELLRVLRTAGTVSVGEPQDIVAQALERMRVISSRAPNRRAAIEGLLRGSAKAHGLHLPDPLVLAVVERFHAAMTADASALPHILSSAEGAVSGVHPLSDEPLSLIIGSQAVTVRTYRRRGQDASDSVVIMVPGRVVGSFKNYMVQDFPGGVLVCARSQTELATLFFEETAASPTQVQR